MFSSFAAQAIVHADPIIKQVMKLSLLVVRSAL